MSSLEFRNAFILRCALLTVIATLITFNVYLGYILTADAIVNIPNKAFVMVFYITVVIPTVALVGMIAGHIFGYILMAVILSISLIVRFCIEFYYNIVVR